MSGKSVEYEVTSLKPIRVRVTAEDGLEYDLKVVVSVSDIRQLKTVQNDGQNAFDVDMSMTLSHKPVVVPIPHGDDVLAG